HRSVEVEYFDGAEGVHEHGPRSRSAQKEQRLAAEEAFEALELGVHQNGIGRGYVARTLNEQILARHLVHDHASAKLRREGHVSRATGRAEYVLKERLATQKSAPELFEEAAAPLGSGVRFDLERARHAHH